jgi:hypothetical protein
MTRRTEREGFQTRKKQHGRCGRLQIRWGCGWTPNQVLCTGQSREEASHPIRKKKRFHGLKVHLSPGLAVKRQLVLRRECQAKQRCKQHVGCCCGLW